MRKFIHIITLFATLFSPHIAANAQTNNRIRGIAIEADTSLPVIQGSVQLLSPKDSSMVEGTATNSEGKFEFNAPAGDYIVKVSYVGFVTQCRDIHHVMSSDGLDIGTIALPPEAYLLQGAKVTAAAQLVSVVADTVVYNPSALNMEEDASLQEILKKIPGMEVSGSTVTLQGKPITEIYVNGQRFFGGDVKSGLENLTADMIDKIAAYERESDFTRSTGIDDGEQVPVLDIRIKKNMMDGWKGNINAGYGLQNRYAARLNASKYEKKSQDVVIANFNDINGKISINNAERTQMGSGSESDNNKRSAGYSFARKSDKLNLDGHVNYNGNNRWMDRAQRIQYIYYNSQSFSNQNSQGTSENNSPKADVRVEWKPDSKNTLIAKASIQYNDIKNWYEHRLGNFNSDPYAIVDNPNEYLVYDSENDPLKSIRNYLTHNFEQNYTSKVSESAFATYSRRLGKKGRNISIYVQESYSFNSSDYFYDKATFNKGKESKPVIRKQYISNTGNNLSLSAQIAYNEPFGKGFHLQLIFRDDHRRNFNDRKYYDMASIAPDWTIRRGLNRQQMINTLPENYKDSYREDLCADGKMNFNIVTIRANLRYIRKKINVTAGVTFNPQWYILDYKDTGIPKTLNKFLFRTAPYAVVNYNPSKTRKLRFQYRTWNGNTSMSNLLPIPSGTDPTYVHWGNPDLTPSFTSEATLSYNSSNILKQNSFILNLIYLNTKDATSSSTEYDPETGYRTVIPKNINGNWYAKGNLTYNKTFKNSRFSTSNHLSGQFNNNVAFLYNSTKKIDEINTTQRTMVKGSSDWTYRIDWLELILNASADYTWEVSLLRPDLNQNPYTLSGCITSTFIMPWKMRFSTDFSFIAQRGFAYENLNRNYLLWNASLSQPLFKKKATLRLEAFDMLGQMINMTRSLSSSSRSTNTYNGVNSYVMLRFIYRFNNAKK